MWFLVLLLIGIIGFLIYVIYQLSVQAEQFEEAIEFFQEWQTKFIETLAEADQKMKEIDQRGSFSTDDEIGFAYETINECIQQLNDIGAITYGGQTEGREEIQGQEEEE